MARHRTALGTRGEDLAASWYEAQGYEVLARNWRCAAGELDVVAQRGCITVFCEVKARTNSAFGGPAEAVTAAKQARIRRLAARWLAQADGGRLIPGRGASADSAGEYLAPGRLAARRPRQVRFDVAAVLGEHLEVIEAAF